MSKPVKELLRKELAERFEGLTSLVVVGFTGLDAVTTNRLRGRLREKDIRLTVVKNSIARQAFNSVGLQAAAKLLDGPSAIASWADDERAGIVVVVRELLDIGKESPELTVKAAILEGEVFGPDRIDELSKYPTRDEAIGRIAGCALAPGAKLTACLLAPGAKLASILKTIEEKQNGDGEANEAA